MREPPRFFIGKLPDGSERWAAIDTSAHHLEARMGERRFGAYLAPFTNEVAARAALIAAGAVNIEAEQGRRSKRVGR